LRQFVGVFIVAEPMKILVPTKRVPDTDQRIVAAADGSRIVLDNIPYVINPFDAIALEEAVRISEKVTDPVEVIAVGIGPDGYEQQLRTALAMGAARAIHIQCDQALDPWNVARLLVVIVERERPDIVLMGKQAVDDDANQTGQFLAALLDWPQATFASRLELLGAEIRVDRETDRGIETLRLPLPAVVTTDLRLNEPRYASLAGIMKARKKPLDVVSAADLGVQIEPRVQIVRYHSADTQRRCERLKSVDELIDRLRHTIPTCAR
jgi:electron transfer flavoprotein beta subunit